MPQEPLFSRDEILSLISELDDAELEGIDKKSLTPLYDEILVSGEGPRVKDRDGKVYLDCTSQAWSLSIGFANPDIAMDVSEQVSRLTHVRYGFPTMPRIKLINKLLKHGSRIFVAATICEFRKSRLGCRNLGRLW